MIDVKKLTIKNCAITVINDIIVTFIAYAIYKYVYFGNWRCVRFGVNNSSLFISWTAHIAFVYPCLFCLNRVTFGHNLIYIRENKPKDKNELV